MKGQIGFQIHPGNELLIRFKDIMVRTLERSGPGAATLHLE